MAMAMVAEPSIIFLDEPSTGMVRGNATTFIAMPYLHTIHYSNYFVSSVLLECLYLYLILS